MSQFEYHRKIVDLTNTFIEGGEMDALDKLGSENWEIIAVFPLPGRDRIFREVWLKRRVD